MSLSTTLELTNLTRTFNGSEVERYKNELVPRYDHLLEVGRTNWTEHLRLNQQIGKGGQGVVYLSERRGTDNFTLPVAVKLFSPERYPDAKSYVMAMSRIAEIASRVAQIQQDHLLDVYNFIERDRIRLLEMEWIDGFDLGRLLTHEMLEAVQHRVSAKRWQQINDVIVTPGPVHPRIKPGVAVEVVRECLVALAALHREDIVHGDIKPSNIMLKRTGSAKIVDYGSAFDVENPPPQQTCTPRYAAPEVLEGNSGTQQSDLASLGYVLIEMLAGRPLFMGFHDLTHLLEAKRALPRVLPELLPEEVVVNQMLMAFLRRMIAPDPMRRFPTAEQADLEQETGAAAFHRQLVKGDLSSEYPNEIRLWLEELKSPVERT
ncbi:MAG: serine/threonine protein kinase [Planctomycetales bacterium]|nr:serine/threonine protein kinase [Planctomycetales bacterium]